MIGRYQNIIVLKIQNHNNFDQKSNFKESEREQSISILASLPTAVLFRYAIELHFAWRRPKASHRIQVTKRWHIHRKVGANYTTDAFERR